MSIYMEITAGNESRLSLKGRGINISECAYFLDKVKAKQW